MINGMLITQIIPPGTALETSTQPVTALTGETGAFQDLFGGLLVQTEMSALSGPKSSGPGAGVGQLLSGTASGTLPFGMLSTAESVSPLKNPQDQVMAQGFVPVSITIDTSLLTGSEQAALEDAGISSGEGIQTLVLLIDHSDLKNLKASVGSGENGVSVPVLLTLPNSDGAGAVKAELTTAPSGNAEHPETGFALKIDIPAPDTNVVDSAMDSTRITDLPASPGAVPTVDNSPDPGDLPANPLDLLKELFYRLTAALERPTADNAGKPSVNAEENNLNNILTALGWEVPAGKEESLKDGLVDVLESLLPGFGFNGKQTIETDGGRADRVESGSVSMPEALAALLVLGGAISRETGTGKTAELETTLRNTAALLETLAGTAGLSADGRREALESYLSPLSQDGSGTAPAITTGDNGVDLTAAVARLILQAFSGSNAEDVPQSSTSGERPVVSSGPDKTVTAEDLLRRLIASLRAMEPGNSTTAPTGELTLRANESTGPAADGRVIPLETPFGSFASFTADGAETPSGSNGKPAAAVATNSSSVVNAMQQTVTVDSGSGAHSAAADAQVSTDSRMQAASVAPEIVQTPAAGLKETAETASALHEQTLSADQVKETSAGDNAIRASRSGRSTPAPDSRILNLAGETTTDVKQNSTDVPASGKNHQSPEKETLKITIPVELSANEAKADRAVSTAQRRQAASAYSGNSFASPGENLPDNNSFNRPAAQVAEAMNARVESLSTLLGDKQSGSQDGSDNARQALAQHQGSDAGAGNVKNEAFVLRMEAAKTPDTAASRALNLANQAEVIDKLSSAARMTLAGGSSEIRIKLEPEHLGFMRVHLRVDENHAVTARIQVESQEARSLIENGLSRLRDSMQEQGLRIEKFSVDVRQDQGQHNQHQQSASFGRDDGYRDRARNGSFGQSGEPTGERGPEGSEKIGSRSPRNYGYNTLEWVA